MKYFCLKCNHQWISRLERDKPRKCPKCQNPNWEKQRIVIGTEPQISEKIEFLKERMVNLSKELSQMRTELNNLIKMMVGK